MNSIDTNLVTIVHKLLFTISLTEFITILKQNINVTESTGLYKYFCTHSMFLYIRVPVKTQLYVAIKSEKYSTPILNANFSMYLKTTIYNPGV